MLVRRRRAAPSAMGPPAKAPLSLGGQRLLIDFFHLQRILRLCPRAFSHSMAHRMGAHFFTARRKSIPPPPRFLLCKNACSAQTRRPICDGAPCESASIPGRTASPDRFFSSPAHPPPVSPRFFPFDGPSNGSPFFYCSAEINSASAKIFALQKCLFGADAPPHLRWGPLRKRLYPWADSVS